MNRREMIAFLRNDLEVPMSSVRRLALAAIRIDQRNVCSHAPRRHGAYRRRKHVRPSVCCIGFDVMADTRSRMSTPKTGSPYTAIIALGIMGARKFSCRGSSSVRGAEGSAMNTHRTVLAIFAAAFVIAVVTAFLTILHNVDTRSASTEAPGTIGLARPHPPLPTHAGQK